MKHPAWLAAAALVMTLTAARAEPVTYPAGKDVPAVGRVQHHILPPGPRHWRGAVQPGLGVTIWYPALPDPGHATPTPPEGPIFLPVPGLVGTGPAAGRHPLLLLSHGTGGSANSLEWLAAGLAALGYIVAGVDHPGNNALEPLTRDGFQLWWERAADLSQMLDALLADPAIGPHIDAARIGAVGFSLGGYTVLALAGGRVDPDAFAAFCASDRADAICRPPEMDRLGAGAAALPPSPETLASLGRAKDSYRDARVKAVFALAPALGQAFTADSLATITVPVALSGGDRDVTVPVDTNIRHLARSIQGATLRLYPGAGHYSFLGRCRPAHMQDLAFICVDGPGVDREALHRQSIEAADRFFAGALPKP